MGPVLGSLSGCLELFAGSHCFGSLARAKAQRAWARYMVKLIQTQSLGQGTHQSSLQ